MRLFPLAVALVLGAAGFAVTDGLRKPSGASAEPQDHAAAPKYQQQLVRREPKIAVAFKLDPEVTRGVFLGDRWVSPPSFFFAQEGSQYVAEAKAQYVDDLGRRTDVAGTWATTAPDMISVTPHATGDATIVVHRPGEGDLTVATSNGSKRVHVKARQVGDGMQVDFRQ